jgi:hypothetical protein
MPARKKRTPVMESANEGQPTLVDQVESALCRTSRHVADAAPDP